VAAIAMGAWHGGITPHHNTKGFQPSENFENPLFGKIFVFPGDLFPLKVEALVVWVQRVRLKPFSVLSHIS
jgi:hypothetical protein